MKKRNRILKVFSLGVGLAIGCVLIAKVCFESAYDSFYKDIDRIYIIKTGVSRQGAVNDFNQISGGVAPGFKQYVPGVEYATRTTFLFESDKYYTEDRRQVSGKLVLADTSFFHVFDRNILEGDPVQVLSQPRMAMVSRSFAEKMGGIDKAVGQVLYNEDASGWKFTIGGIYEDFPENGSMNCDLLLSMASYDKWSRENWLGNDRYVGFVKLEEGVDPSFLTEAIHSMQEKNQPLEELEKSGSKIWYYLSAFDKLHTSDPQVRNMIVILSIVSLVLLLISLMNYILITISEMVSRSKEIGVHKCYGAGRWDIYKMLCKETMKVLLMALGFSAVLVWAAKPLVEDLLGASLRALFIPETIGVLIGVIFLLFLVSTIVPGYLYDKIPVGVAFRNYRENKRKWKLALLWVQFTINIFLVCFMLVIAAQYDKALNDRPGYTYENVLYYNVRGVDQLQASRSIAAILSNPEVVDVERCYGLPFDYCSGNNIYLPGDDRELFNIADQYAGTKGFFDFFEIPMLEGRVPETIQEVAVSRKFVEKMKEFADWKDGAIGKEIYVTEHSDSSGMNQGILTITGVYEDYRIGLLTRNDERPSIRFTADPELYADFMPYVLIKVKQLTPEVISEIQKDVQKEITGKDIEIFSYKQVMQSMYDDNRKMKNTILIGSLFSIVIAFLGLIGYIRDESQRRSKEIAIRKINGATSSEILSLFVSEIMKWVLAAAIVGDLAAYYVSGLWLEQFSEKVTVSLWYLLAADLIVALIVAVTVVINSLQITRANPVLSLKNE
ncbi:FtsX-like permease family protein [Phocaeicola coprophilus]|uniref:FtsX-like permease family protein n=1 Tax=Phocaeicola coprophilus TaxID=387090 RepID=UPI002941CC6F|nr:FtsX-like permease family protein [Phocaeicola coprophilus]